MLIKRIKKELSFRLGNIIPIEIKKGLCRGMKLYGNLFYNRRQQELYAEEILYVNIDLDGKIVIEAGSHLGAYTMFFAKAVGKGNVMAFEPNPFLFTLLTRNINKNSFTNVLAINAGLSNVSGQMRLISPRHNMSKGTFKLDKQELMKKAEAPFIEKNVPVTTIDQALNDHSIQRVDFVKIDTEGYEPFIIMGMSSTLQKHKPLIYFEIHGLNKDQKQADLKQIYDFLWVFNYRIEKLAKDSCEINYENLIEQEGGGFLAWPADKKPDFIIGEILKDHGSL
jgi:FkbM family methyltransferase